MSTAPVSAADPAADSRPVAAGFGGSRRFLAALPDARLVERVRRGNELAFEVLYDRYSGRILSFCRHMLGSRDEAEDAVQHTFLAAYRDITGGERDVNLKPWLFTIARNRCISMIRARHEQPDEAIELSTTGLSEEVEQRAELRELVRDLHELPVEQRAALLLAELGDLSHPEIAGVLDCPAPRVKALVFQARSNLIQRRDARETPCREIRADIATLGGRAVRRGVIRRHLSGCPGCAEFWNETRRQRELLGLALPVVPTLVLKERALAATGVLAGGGGGGGGIAGVLAGGLAARSTTVALFAGGAVLAVGATVTGIGAATGSGPEAKPAPAAEAPEHPPASARRSAPAAPRRANRGGEGAGSGRGGSRRGGGRGSDGGGSGRGGDSDRGGSAPDGAVEQPAPGVTTTAPPPLPTAGGGADPPGTPRRARTRRHGGGPSPNANPVAGPPKSPDHPSPPNGGGNGNAGGQGNGNGPKPR